MDDVKTSKEQSLSDTGIKKPKKKSEAELKMELRKALRKALQSQKIYCDGLGDFMQEHKKIKWRTKEWHTDPVTKLFADADISSDKLQNWARKKDPTSIRRNEFITLINLLRKISEDVDPKKISSEYLTNEEIEMRIDNLFAGCLTPDDLAEINLAIMKSDVIYEVFIATKPVDICKWILYFDVLAKFDLDLCRYISMVLCMTNEGKKKTAELFHNEINFNDFIKYVRLSKDVIALKEKIEDRHIVNGETKCNKMEKEVQDYLDDIQKGNNDEHEQIIEELWNAFVEKIDSLYDGYDSTEEYLFFHIKMDLFLYLFKTNNSDIWNWIINYFRVEDKDKLLKKIKRIYKENPNSKIPEKYAYTNKNELWKD